MPRKRSHEIIFSQEGEELIYYPHFFELDLFDFLIKELPWRQNQIKVYGKIHLEPRHTAWFGKPYSYSSIHWPETPLPSWLEEMIASIESEIPFTFNSVLFNHYRNGLDSMGWHRDNEPEINSTMIASVSFGVTRPLFFRNRNSQHKIECPLESGSLLIMKNFQNNWLHALPKRSKITDGRINATFRQLT